MAVKRYYWIKLKDTFLTSDAVDFLMSQKNGANYVVLYQMLCLKTVNTGGELSRQIGEVIIPFDIDKIHRDCKYFEKDTVVVALELYQKLGLVYENKDGFLQIANFDNLVGSETRQAGLMREKRKRINKIEQTANQNKTFYIDNYTNKKRYGGNYYYVLERDKKRCASCGSTETLCVHHIIGYDENEPKSCNASSMITLCRTCHSNEHNNPHSVVTNKLLDDISFDMELYSLISTINPNSRGNNVTRELQKSYSKVTQEKDIRDKILDTRYNSIDIDSNNNSNSNNTNVQHEQQDCSLPKENIFITLSLNDNSEFEVTENYLKKLKPLFPAVNIEQEFRKMCAWSINNPKKRKTRKGITRFINNWLSNAQDKAHFNSNNNSQNDFEQRKNQFADIIRKNRRTQERYL